jgi:hypothetical protein
MSYIWSCTPLEYRAQKLCGGYESSCTALVRLSATIRRRYGEPNRVADNMLIVLGLELEQMMDALGEAVLLSSDDG